MSDIKLLIGADLVATESNMDLFRSGDAGTLLGAELRQLLADGDCRIFNLETPLTDRESPIDKCGPNLMASTDAVHGYREIGADILTLANNHIMDQGAQGMHSTCDILDQNGIAWLGVGETPAQAAKPHIFCCKGKKIGFYACAEHEFSIVDRSSCGANPFDPLESPDHIAELKRKCDYVIVLYHGGKEHFRYPSPNLQKVCRKLVEKGADLVLCQHSHCIGCEEKFQDGTIVYGQGNFLFDHSESEYWQTGLLVQVGAGFQISYIPLVKRQQTVCLADQAQAQEILSQFRKRSEEIKEEGFIEKNYQAFAASKIDAYLFAFTGIRRTILYKILNRISGRKLTELIVKKKFHREQLLALQNYMECEAHRELVLCGIVKRIS